MAVAVDFVQARHEGNSHYLVDGRGRRLFLRGVNANGLIEYAADYQEEVPLTENDFVEMRALGFNFLRLPISWSRIMPTPAAPNHAYLDHIRAMVNMAGEQKIYVLIDFHQDNYARNLAPDRESDGAPEWAVLTDDWRCNWKMSGNPAVQSAWSHFWKNFRVQNKPLHDHYLDALRVVVRAVADSPWVLAYDVMNEPDPGWALPGYFEARYLFPFYARAVAAIREVDRHHLILFEPSVIRDATNIAIQCSRPFSRDSQLIYGPHCYTEVASPPFHPVGSRSNPCLWACYASAAMEARGFGTPWLFGEFGVDPTPAGDGWIRDQMRFQRQFGVGAAFWVWKQRPGFYGWAVVEPDGELRRTTERAQILAQPRPVALPGVEHRVCYDLRERMLTVSGYLPASGLEPAELYASKFTYPEYPNLQVVTPSGMRQVRSSVTAVSYPPVPEVQGWEISLDLSKIRGPYQLIMTPA